MADNVNWYCNKSPKVRNDVHTILRWLWCGAVITNFRMPYLIKAAHIVNVFDRFSRNSEEYECYKWNYSIGFSLQFAIHESFYRYQYEPKSERNKAVRKKSGKKDLLEAMKTTNS
jgi:hypothetical protein